MDGRTEGRGDRRRSQTYGAQTYGAQTYGAQTYGAQTYGAQTSTRAGAHLVQPTHANHRHARLDEIGAHSLKWGAVSSPRGSWPPEVDMSRTVRSFLAATFCMAALACDQSGPSVAEALESKAPDVPPGYTPNPKARPEDLKPPSDAEFAAWDRKDPEGEKHLYKWDKENGTRMLGYWEQLQCFREQVMAEGQKAFGAEPGSPAEEQWYQYKRSYVVHLDGWQQRLFAQEPRVLEKSKFIGNVLEGHEMVMNNYPKAYNEGDKTELEKVEAHWTIVEQKMKKYSKNLGLDWAPRDLTDPKQAEAHAKVCEDAFTPPDRSGKAKRGKKKGPI